MSNNQEADTGKDIVESSEVTIDIEEKCKSKRSWTFEHFIHDKDKNNYKCKVCRKILTARPDKSTGNLHDHLKTRHKDIYESSVGAAAPKKSKPIQLSLKETCDLTAKKLEKLTREGFLERLIRFIISSDQPINIVDDTHLRELISYISKDREISKLPGRTSMTEKIDMEFVTRKESLKTLLGSLSSKVSLIIDCWTSSNQIAFQGVICRFVDSGWNLVTVPIDLTLLSGPHTGENIAAALLPVLDDFKITGKVLSITTDNATNMDTFFEEFSESLEKRGIIFDINNQRVRCLAHILNLTAKTILDQFEKNELVCGSIKKLRDVILAIRASPQRRENYFRNCDSIGKEKNMVIMDVKTRWNSCYDMIIRAIEMKEALEATMQSSKDLRGHKLDDEQWEQLKLLTNILMPIKQATEMISKEKSPNIASASMIYQYLFDHFESYTQTAASSRRKGTVENSPENWMYESAKAGMAKLEKYYPESDGKVYVIGTVLHPGFKLEWYKQSKWPSEWIKKCQTLITNEWNTYYKPKDSLTDQNAVNDESEDFFGSLYRSKMASCSKGATDDLKRYLAEGIVSPEILNRTGLLGWWKDHEAEYKHLSEMAKDYLAVGGSGVPVESFFSSGTDILTENRQRLSAEHIKDLMLLKSWFKIL